ncbi:hypothetical protein [Undibacterium sp. Di24W]|uniref:hypothetical protein n=1 Tax=Undibacterium sp. Di24W TaxID=3413033 RepID=UPI003BF2432A
MTMYRQRRLFILLAALTVGASASERAAGSDFVVIANLRSGITKMSKDEVINVYMGRNRKLASGITAMPLDLENPLAVKAHFYSVLVNKDLSEISSYWARLVFSGQGSPPRQVKSQEEAIEIVTRRRGAIAYIERTKIDKRVKVVFDPLR